MQFGKKGVNGRQQRHASTSAWSAKIFVDEKNNEAVRRRRLRQQARRGHRRRHRQVQALLGRVRQQAGRHGPRAATTRRRRSSQQFRNPVHCADLSIDGFVYVCDRINDRIQVFTNDGKFVKESVHREGLARRRLDVGHRVLEGSAAEVHLPRRRRATRRSTSSTASRCRSLTSFGDGGRQPGPVLRGAQHRDRLEGQPLHDGNLPGPPRAEVRRQGSRAGAAQGHGRRLADDDHAASVNGREVDCGPLSRHIVGSSRALSVRSDYLRVSLQSFSLQGFRVSTVRVVFFCACAFASQPSPPPSRLPAAVPRYRSCELPRPASPNRRSSMA